MRNRFNLARVFRCFFFFFFFFLGGGGGGGYMARMTSAGTSIHQTQHSVLIYERKFIWWAEDMVLYRNQLSRQEESTLTLVVSNCKYLAPWSGGGNCGGGGGGGLSPFIFPSSGSFTETWGGGGNSSPLLPSSDSCTETWGITLPLYSQALVNAVVGEVNLPLYFQAFVDPKRPHGRID